MIRDFDFYVGGTEDELIKKLDSTLGVKHGAYAKKVESYGGEFDADVIREYLTEYLGLLPLFLVCYEVGDDKTNPATGVERGKPRVVEHEAFFDIFAASGDARGERARRRGVAGGVGAYKMISDVRTTLSGLDLFKDDGDEKVLLTLDPLTLAGVVYPIRLPEITAYAQRVRTRFKWLEPDRREEGRAVEQVTIDLNSTSVGTGGANMPGVNIGQ